jgi:glutamate racemase
MIRPDSPIGLFDSGVGGLTVANAIKSLLPNEKMIYFGDTAHLPYGDKSKETIVQYSIAISDFLIRKNCKLILIACNSASSNAYDEVKEFVDGRAHVLNVIDPVIRFVAGEDNPGEVGVIGTKATINSDMYAKKLYELNKGISVSSLATPLLVPMIEEGFIFDDISNAIIRTYLSKKELAKIQTLILGCTHYPIIKNQISKFYDFRVDVIDSAKIVAEELRSILQANNLLCPALKDDHEFFVSDHTNYFEIIAKMFFGEKINLKKINPEA